MPYQAFKILDVDWTDIKAYKTRDVFTFYYVAGPSNASYEVIGISNNFIYRTKLSLAADVSDFVTNYLGAAIAAESIDDAIATANINELNRVNITGTGGTVTTTPVGTNQIGLDVNVVSSLPTISTGNIVWTEARVTTNTQAQYTVATYTVPTGKEFYLMQFSLDRISVNNTNCEATVTITSGVTTTEFAATGFNGSNQAAWTVFMTVALCRIAGAGDVVAIRITPSSSTTTQWAGRIIGALK